MEGNSEKPATPARSVAGLDPIGEALRVTYDAENHDTLGSDLTGLMLALTRIDDPVVPSSPVRVPAVPNPVPTVPRSWRQRLFGQ